MDDFNSETDSDYTSYWRDWLGITYRGQRYMDGQPGKAQHSSKSCRLIIDMDSYLGRLVRPPDDTKSDLDSVLRRRQRPRSAFDRNEPLLNSYYLNTTLDKALADRRTLQFISSRGNEYFCEIDEDYLTDRFNLTGLNTEVQYYQYALDLVTDVFDLDCDDEMRETIEKSARHLYGLVHARYIVTTRGLAKMLEKYKKADFGKCPRVMCKSHPLLPMGQSDNPNIKAVKLYCAKCEDIYNPKSSRHSAIDGAYFGTSFHNIIFQVYPALIPPKSADRYIPRIYGFRVHAPATLIRWQGGQKDDMRKRLRKLEIDSGFKDDEEEIEAEDSDEEDEEEEEIEMDAFLGNREEQGGGDLQNNQI